MLDENRVFDVSSIEEDLAETLRPYAPRGNRDVADAALRRPVAVRDSQDHGQASNHAQSVGQSTRAPDAGQTERLLEDRGTTHGSFENNARVSQYIKRAFRNESGWHSLTDVEREAMDMIALKFSRVLSGKSLEKQHWEDVVGYAQLALNQCIAEAK